MSTQESNTLSPASDPRGTDQAAGGRTRPPVMEAAPKLSRSGFLFLIVGLLLSPVVIIGMVWFLLPPIREAPLEATAKFRDFLQVAEFKALPESEKQKLLERIKAEEFLPAIVIVNSSDTEWRNLGVNLNGSFDYFSAETLPVGEEQLLYLHAFTTRQGDPFRPLEYVIREVTVSARLPSGERGIFEADVDEFGRIVPRKKSED